MDDATDALESTFSHVVGDIGNAAIWEIKSINSDRS